MTVPILKQKPSLVFRYRTCIRPPILLILLVLSFIVGLHTRIWVLHWRRERAATEPIVHQHQQKDQSPIQSKCAVWTPQQQQQNRTTGVVGIEFREHIRTSLHKGHFHFFHLLEFVVVSWVELRSSFSMHQDGFGDVVVAWVRIPHMTYEQAYGPDMNRLLLRMVFGPQVQLISLDTRPAPAVDSVLSIERSKCTDASVKKMWWKHMYRFASAAWHDNLRLPASAPAEEEGTTTAAASSSKLIRIAYIDRQNTRRRFPPFFHRWLLRYVGHEVVRQYAPQATIEFTHLHHMEDLSATEQVRATAPIDILISMHGNGLSHQFFMAPGGAVVEVFWEFPFCFDYATAALMLDHAYLGLWNGQVLPHDRIQRLDPTLRTGEYAAGKLYAWYETEWTSRRVAERVEASQRAIREFLEKEIDRRVIQQAME